MLLSLASWSLLSSAGAWKTEHSTCPVVIVAEEKGSRGFQITSLSIHIHPQNSCLVLLCPLAQATSKSLFSFSTINPWARIRIHKPVLFSEPRFRFWAICMKITWRYLHVYCTRRCIFTLCFKIFSDHVLMCCTYCEEEHAVHSKRGVTGVEGQSAEEKESNLRLHVGYLDCKIELASLSCEMC